MAIHLDWRDLGPAPIQTAAFTEIQPPPPVKQVRAVLTPIKQTSPAAPDAYANLMALHSAGKYRELVPIANAAIKANPKLKTLYVPLANAHYKLGTYQLSLESAQKHLELCPNCVWALERSAVCNVALGEHGEAIRILEQLLQNAPNTALACNSLAWIYCNGPNAVRDSEKALPLAQRAVALARDNAWYQTTLGVVYYRLGKLDQAADTLKASLRPSLAKSTQALNHYFLAMCYQRLGQPDHAKRYLQEAATWAGLNLPPHTIRLLEDAHDEAAALLSIK